MGSIIGRGVSWGEPAVRGGEEDQMVRNNLNTNDETGSGPMGGILTKQACKIKEKGNQTLQSSAYTAELPLRTCQPCSQKHYYLLGLQGPYVSDFYRKIQQVNKHSLSAKI